MRLVLVALIGSSLLGVPMIVGCDRTVEEQKTTKSGPGGSSTSEQKTVQHPDGSVSTSTEKHSTNNNP